MALIVDVDGFAAGTARRRRRRQLADDGMTMMIVTHEVPFAREISDWVTFLDGGRVIEEGPPREVLDKPRQARTRAFLTSYDSGR